jgi:hypothetical protein
MLPDRQDDEKVSRRAAILAHLPFSSYPQAGALLRARGSLDGEGLGSLQLTASSAPWTRPGDVFPFSLAAVAGRFHDKKSSMALKGPRASAVGTKLRLRPRSTTTPPAERADRLAVELNLLGGTKGCFLQGNFQAVAKVRPPFFLRLWALGPEKILQNLLENSVEDIFGPGEAGRWPNPLESSLAPGRSLAVV